MLICKTNDKLVIETVVNKRVIDTLVNVLVIHTVVNKLLIVTVVNKLVIKTVVNKKTFFICEQSEEVLQIKCIIRRPFRFVLSAHQSKMHKPNDHMTKILLLMLFPI